MTSLELFEKMDCLNDKYILDAEVSPVYSQVVTKKHTARDFWESPWVVAALCACVSLFLLGGIIWAGNSSTPPISAGTQAEETEISPEIEQTTPTQEDVTEPVTQAEEITTQATTQTEEITTQAETEEDIPAPEYETNEDGLYILMTEPYVWESISPSANELIQQIDIEVPEGITMRRTAVYQKAWVVDEEQDIYIMEVQEFTDCEGNRTINLVFRYPQNIDHVRWEETFEIGKGYWGLAHEVSGAIVFYYTTPNINPSLPPYLEAQMFHFAEVMAPPDYEGLVGVILQKDTDKLYPPTSSDYTSEESMRSYRIYWNRCLFNVSNEYVKEKPSWRMIADDFFGESAFFGEGKEIEGWERLQKFLLFQPRDEFTNPTIPTVDTTPETTITQEPTDTSP